MSKPKLN